MGLKDGILATGQIKYKKKVYNSNSVNIFVVQNTL